MYELQYSFLHSMWLTPIIMSYIKQQIDVNEMTNGSVSKATKTDSSNMCTFICWKYDFVNSCFEKIHQNSCPIQSKAQDTLTLISIN